MRLHFQSVVVGVVAVSIILVSMSQAPVGSSNAPRIEYGPHPRDMVQIRQGTPYLVPAGQVFVLTGLGGVQPTQAQLGTLRVNGQVELGYLADHSPSVASVPTGFTVAAGSTIEVSGPIGGPEARAWGYLSK